jgi:transcriptional regulator with GAF, ATPase, and Fis domain
MKKKLSDLEKLVIKFSQQFANAPVFKIQDKIDDALREIVECLGADRCVFWEMSENFTDFIISNYYAVSGIDDTKNISYQDFPWILENTLAGNHICMGSLEDMPEEAAQDRESLWKLGIKSFIAIPYSIGGYQVSGLTFDSSNKELICEDDLIVKLKLIGEIITGAFYRMRMEEKYRKNITEARKSDNQIQNGDFPLRQDTKEECRFEGIVGNSAVMKLVFSRMQQVAPTNSVVLVLGETGTGKGVIARAIHDLSLRRDKRIVTVNCAALTPNLIESELFGREKGAYTGSTEMQIGRFELSDHGTLVLDEITELPLDLQAKLLRAIQEGEFERLGSPKTIKVDVRIIALTSRNLKEEVAKGRFRQDLYYRLNVFPIIMPPLRQRKEDIPLLLNYYLELFNRRMQKNINVVPERVMAELMAYSWPGNVRELEHIIERSVITTQGQSFHLAEKLDDSEADISDDDITNLDEVEKRHIIKVLEKANWRIEGSKGAAILLGLHPNTLRGRMQKLGIHIQKSTP